MTAHIRITLDTHHATPPAAQPPPIPGRSPSRQGAYGVAGSVTT